MQELEQWKMFVFFRNKGKTETGKYWHTFKPQSIMKLILFVLLGENNDLQKGREIQLYNIAISNSQ